MKWLLIVAILLGPVSHAAVAEESLGKKIKKILAPSPTPTPTRKHRKTSAKKASPTPTPTASAKRKKASPTPSPTPKSKTKHKKASPTPTPGESPSETETPSASPAESPEWPNVSLSPNAIEGYEKYPAKVRQILDAGLALTKENLGYTYGSGDPANGGMDCSGFIYYVLKQNGFPDVPRQKSRSPGLRSSSSNECSLRLTTALKSPALRTQTYCWLESRGTSGKPFCFRT